METHQLIGAQQTEQPTQQALRWLSEAEAKVTNAQATPVKHKRPLTFRRLLLL